MVTVSGYKANGSEAWYLPTFMIDSKEVQGYIRSDFVTLSGELVAPETQPETPVDNGDDAAAEEPEEAPAYETEQEGDCLRYLIDNVAGKKITINKLITEAEQNAEKHHSLQKGFQARAIIILLVIIL